MTHRFALTAMIVVSLAGCSPRLPGRNAQDRYDDAERWLSEATGEVTRLAALPRAAKAEFDVGRFADAEAHAKEALRLAGDHTLPRMGPVGNAVHDGHVVLGRLALRAGDKTAARDHLLLAGGTTGSATLASFGPNMTLARDLLLIGERKAVLDYLEKCRRFWNYDRGNINAWEDAIKRGEMPDFGANLVY